MNIQGNASVFSAFSFSIGANSVTTTASSVSVVTVQVGGASHTTDMVLSIQPRSIADFTSSYIPTINGVITADGVMTLYITNGSSAHSTVIAANTIFNCTIIRQENGFVNNSL